MCVSQTDGPEEKKGSTSWLMAPTKTNTSFSCKLAIYLNLSTAKGLTPVVNMHEFMAIKNRRAVGEGDTDSTGRKSYGPFNTTEM